MTFETFSRRYRLRMKTDVDRTPIIAGKNGHIFEYGAGEYGVVLMLKTPRAFGFALKRLVAAGCMIRQRGDAEGTASFSPDNLQSVRQAIREAKVARIPRRTAAQLAALREKGSRFRFGASATSTVQNTSAVTETAIRS